MSRALDIGCTVGRSTFELAHEYDEVLGVDISPAFVEKCNELKRDGQADYAMIVEGDLMDCKTAYIDTTIVSLPTSDDRFIVQYLINSLTAGRQ